MSWGASQWQLESGPGGSIYGTAISKHYKSGLCVALGELVVKYLSAQLCLRTPLMWSVPQIKHISCLGGQYQSFLDRCPLPFPVTFGPNEMV